MSDATDKQLEEALPCNMRCSPGITHSVHCFAAHRPAVRALIDALIAGALLERTAQIAAHRACCGTEHDPANGKLHGYCVVCGVPWPCEYAGLPSSACHDAKLIADTLRSLLAEFTPSVKDGPAMMYSTEAIKQIINGLSPTTIAAQAEERDRRVTAEATRQTLMEIAANYGIAEKSNQMGAFKEGLGKRLEAAHRAAVQEKPHET